MRGAFIYAHVQVCKVWEGSIELVNEAITMQRVKEWGVSLFGVVGSLERKREGTYFVYHVFTY